MLTDDEIYRAACLSVRAQLAAHRARKIEMAAAEMIAKAKESRLSHQSSLNWRGVVGAVSIIGLLVMQFLPRHPPPSFHELVAARPKIPHPPVYTTFWPDILVNNSLLIIKGIVLAYVFFLVAVVVIAAVRAETGGYKYPSRYRPNGRRRR